MLLKPAKCPFKLVHVTWRDAEGDTSWMNIDEVREETRKTELCPNETVGWILEETKNWLVTCNTLGWNGDWLLNGISRIPTGMVLKITRLN
jgi:hypothetical protein